MGLLCLSEDSTNIPMWAHYAAEHKGFVLGFESTHEFFDKRADGTGLWQVRYSDKRPFRPTQDVYDNLRQQPAPHSTGLIDVVLPILPTFNPDTYHDDYRFIKSRHWKYEKEWRLMRTLEHPDVTLPNGKFLPIHLFRFPADCLKCVVIGCRGIKHLYERIRTIIKSNPLYSHVSIHIAEANEARFALDIRPFQPREEIDSPSELNKLPLPEQVDFLLSKGILSAIDENDHLIDPDDA